MRKAVFASHLLMVVVSGASFLFLTAGCLAQLLHQPSSKQDDSLKTFLQNYLGSSDDAKKTRYYSAFVDLKDDGMQEVVVYLTGDGLCGSGGCATLILAPKDSSYRIVTKLTIVSPPVRILATKSNGWHDIAVQVQGGGILHAYEAKLSFDGRSYPRNPSILPARRLVEKTAGEVVVPLAGEEMPLY